jgi:hypothetical protein
LASSEGSPPLPYPWTNSTKGFFPSEAIIGGRVWDRVRKWLVPLSAGDCPDKGFLKKPQWFDEIPQPSTFNFQTTFVSRRFELK